MKQALLIVALLLFACRTCAVLSNREKAKEEETTTISASAALTPIGVEITNEDSADCVRPQVTIHAGVTTFYKADISTIPPGKKSTTPYSDFTDTDGTRFNYARTKASMITMKCTFNGKKAVVGWKF